MEGRREVCISECINEWSSSLLIEIHANLVVSRHGAKGKKRQKKSFFFFFHFNPSHYTKQSRCKTQLIIHGQWGSGLHGWPASCPNKEGAVLPDVRLSSTIRNVRHCGRHPRGLHYGFLMHSWRLYKCILY